MSLINRMLQDLDRRQALASATDTPVAHVRSVPAGPAPRREWLWRILAAVMLIALGWACWVAYQIWPRPIATDLALRENFKAMSAATPQVSAPAAGSPRPAEPASQSAKPPSAAEGAPDRLRMASEINTPIRSAPAAAAPLEPAPKAAARSATARDNDLAAARQIAPVPATPHAETALARPADAAPKPAPRPAAASPLREAAPASSARGSVDKRDRVRTPSERAELLFRQAVGLLNQGRSSEGEEQLVAALNIDPRHQAARQAQVALLIEQGKIDAARRALQEALAVDPTHAQFAAALARIFADRRDYDSALQVLGRIAPENAGDPDVLALKAGILQRMGRHAEAAEAYEQALRGAPNLATSWVGYAISLDSLGRRGEAAQAYRRALAAGRLPPEVRDYAEKRLRAPN